MGEFIGIVIALCVVIGANVAFSALAIYVASIIFGFTFKWIYVVCPVIAQRILRSICEE